MSLPVQCGYSSPTEGSVRKNDWSPRRNKAGALLGRKRRIIVDLKKKTYILVATDALYQFYKDSVGESLGFAVLCCVVSTFALSCPAVCRHRP